MPDAFVSYARSDGQEFVVRLHGALEADGRAIWVDLSDIPPASTWERDLREGIVDSDAVIFVISPASAVSKHCAAELEYAFELDKRVVPVLLAPPQARLPPGIAELNWVPQTGVFEDDFEGSLRTLRTALDTDLPWVRGHTRWLKRATEWEASGQDRSKLLRGSELDEAEDWFDGQAGKDPVPTSLHTGFIRASRRAASRRLRGIVAAVSAALLVAIALAVVALLQRNEAVRQQEIANSRELAASSSAALERDPELALLLALEALGKRATAQAEQALREALGSSDVRARFTGHSGPLADIALAPDDRLAASASEDGSARTWDPATGRERDVVRLQGGVSSVAFAPDGSLALGGTRGEIRAPGLHLAAGDTELASLRYSPDGRRLAQAAANGRVTVWDARTGTSLRTLRAHAGTAWDAEFSPDGRLLVTAGADGLVRVWDIGRGRAITTYRRHGGEVFGATFSPDGGLVLSTSVDGRGRIWEVRTGRDHAELAGHSGAVLDGAFTPDGRFAVTASADQTIRVWDAATGRQLEVLRGHSGAVARVELGPRGSILSAGVDGTARRWESDVLAGAIGAHGGVVYALAFAGPGLLASSGSEGSVRLWDVARRRAAGVLLDGPEDQFALATAHGLVAAGGKDGIARVWRTNGGEPIASFDAGHDQLLGVAISLDERLLATGGANGGAAVWDIETGERVALFAGHDASVSSVAFDPEGRRVVTGSADRLARIWDIRSESVVRTIRGNQAAVTHAEFSPDGTRVVTAGQDGGVRVWRTDDGSQVFGYRHGEAALEARFSADGRLVASGGSDEVVQVRDTETGERLADFSGFLDGAWSVAFDPSGRRLAVGGATGAISLHPCDVCTTDLARLVALSEGRVTRPLTPAERDELLPH